MPWCRHTRSHYLSQCWPRSMWLNVVTRPQSVKPMILIGATTCSITLHTLYMYLIRKHVTYTWYRNTSHQQKSYIRYECSYARDSSIAICTLGAGNYHQPQLPSANMADSDVGTERYSLFMQLLSTHFGVWGLYTTEYHVCTYWTPTFDLIVVTFAARRWGKNGGLMVIYNTVWW